MWNVTPDGSVVDENGKVLVFSTKRFIGDICLGDCCFICGAKPDEKPFNNEHILPDWMLRRYDLFARTITLPNGTLVRYDRYTVPCCVDCNSLMGQEIEKPISEAVHGGPESFAEFIHNNGLHVITWMGLIYLKTHLKDRKYRVHLDQRKGEEKIADQYEWEYLQHLHAMVRSFYTGCRVDKEAVGSFLGVSVTEQASAEKFDFGDLYLAQTMFLRLDEMGMVAVFNDSGAAMSRFWERLQRITGPVSELQLREIMVDFSYLNLHLKERPIFEVESNISDQTCRISVKRGSLDLVDLDIAVRGRLMHHAFKDILPCIHHSPFAQRSSEGLFPQRFLAQRCPRGYPYHPRPTK
jgi:hypothetical protein